VFDTRPEGTRRIGWEDGVIQEMRQGPGSEGLEDVTMNRKDWLKPLKKARVRTEECPSPLQNVRETFLQRVEMNACS
jgi:hypothetical protein